MGSSSYCHELRTRPTSKLLFESLARKSDASPALSSLGTNDFHISIAQLLDFALVCYRRKQGPGRSCWGPEFSDAGMKAPGLRSFRADGGRSSEISWGAVHTYRSGGRIYLQRTFVTATPSRRTCHIKRGLIDVGRFYKEIRRRTRTHLVFLSRSGTTPERHFTLSDYQLRLHTSVHT